MSYETENDWTTKAGYRAVCLMVNDGSHRCGYVEIPADHPLHGVEYGTEHPLLVLSEDEPIGKRGVIDVFLRAARDSDEQGETPALYFNVHGGITFSRFAKEGYPVESNGWWYGFDCAHAGDASGGYRHPGDVFRSQEYVEAECEALAEQLAAVARSFIAEAMPLGGAA